MNLSMEIINSTALTETTVQKIRQLIRESGRSPLVRRATEDAIVGVNQKDWLSEIKAVFAWVRKNFHYTRDTYNLELVKTPDRHVTDIIERGVTYGDCDDATVLLGAMLYSIGFKVQLVIMRSTWNTDIGTFNHIYLRALLPPIQTWIALDITALQENAGYEPEGAEKRTYNV